jgi:uncharacterized membrane protein YgcG
MKYIFVLLLLSFNLLFASSDESIDTYFVDINISQNGTLEIEETIDYNFFTNLRHGIKRDIPYLMKNKDGFREDIDLDNFKIFKDGVEEKFEKSDEEGQIKLKIGDAFKYITSKHRYKILYSVKNLYIDNSTTKDVLRWNIIGTQWQTPIKKVVATIRLPEKFSKNSVDVATFSGGYGSTSTKAFSEWRDDKTLRVEMENLNLYEGLTLSLSFSKNSLTLHQSQTIIDEILLNLKKVWYFLLGGLFWLYMARYTSKFGKKPKLHAISVSYEAPTGIDILEAGLIYDKYADNRDFASGIVELAQLGYLKIVNSSNLLHLEKLKKDSTSLSTSQKSLLKTLFGYSSTFYFDEKLYAQSLKLKNDFEAINNNLYESVKLKGYMQDNVQESRKAFLWRILAIMSIFAIGGFILSSSLFGLDLILTMSFITCFILIGAMMFLVSQELIVKIIGIFFFIIFMIMALFLWNESNPSIWAVGFFVSFIFLVILSTIYIKKIGIYTQKGIEIYAKLEGFKMFIKRVKADEIKRLMSENDKFLDQTLAYAMLFGYVDKWSDFYEKLHIQNPDWYDGDIYAISNFSSTINTYTNPTTSSSDSSSGGDFSGGGGGGGGGDSW